jgi:signal transduction histidine kinase
MIRQTVVFSPIEGRRFLGDAVENGSQRSKGISLSVSACAPVCLSLVLCFLFSAATALPAVATNSALQQQRCSLAIDRNPTFSLHKLELRAHSSDARNTGENEHSVNNSRSERPRRILIVIICILSALIVYLVYIVNSLSKALHEGRRNESPQPIEGASRQAPQLESDLDLPMDAHKLIVVGTLIPGIFHDLNNRVNNIALSADVLIDEYEDLPDAERLDIANDIFKESKNAKNVVQSMSGFAMESESERKPHDLPAMIEGVLRLAAKHIMRSKVKIRGEVLPDLPRVSCIRWKVEHVFLSIMLNAIESMPEGGTLTISCDMAPDGDFVSIEFTDAGFGIPEENLSDIFKPSFTTKPRTRALGLGLPVSLYIVKEHGGDIHVKSQVGKGSAFTILLPADRSS